jgi:hypothetical protein
MIDLRFIKRDGKMILQWRQATDIKSDKTLKEIFEEQVLYGTAFNKVTATWDEWQDVRVEE